jgi:hypothetical protein
MGEAMREENDGAYAIIPAWLFWTGLGVYGVVIIGMAIYLLLGGLG